MTRTIDARRLSRALDLVIADAVHPVVGQPGKFVVLSLSGAGAYLHEGSVLMILEPPAPKPAPTQGRFIGPAGAVHLLEAPDDVNPFD